MQLVKGFDHINFNVENLDKSVQFFKNIFGFEQKEEGVSPRGNKYKIIGISGVAYLALYEDKQKHEYAGLNHLGINVPNTDELLKRLEKHNIKIEMDYDYENSRSLYITDPNGIEIEVSSNFGGGL